MNTQSVSWPSERAIDVFAKRSRVFARVSWRKLNGFWAGKTWAVWFAFLVSGLAWLAGTSIVRRVAPGQKPLERHEFESVETRRGGFGNVF